MKCEKCGYILQPFEEECPRCKYLAAQKCELCGRPGIVGSCRQCHREACADCLPQGDGSAPLTTGGLCRSCAPEQFHPPALTPEMRTLNRMSYSTGFFDSVGRAFAFIGQSMGMAFRDKDLLLPSLFAFLANGVIVGGILLAAHRTGHLKTLLERGKNEPNLQWALLLLALAFICYVITYFFMGMTVNLVSARLHGRDARLGEAFRDAMKNAAALISLAFVSLLVALFTGMLRRRRGLDAGDVAAWAIQRTWTVATYLIVPIIILEDLAFLKSLERAKVLHWRNFVPIAVGEIAVSVVNGAVLFLVIMGVIGLAGYAHFAGQQALFFTTVIVGGVVFLTAVCFTEFVRTAYYTCLYLWAAERERVGEEARIPTPLAAALAR